MAASVRHADAPIAQMTVIQLNAPDAYSTSKRGRVRASRRGRSIRGECQYMEDGMPVIRHVV